ncbi:lipopolysaccharide biosynthesis protein [Kribbella sp. CA-294648]|uniref:lipopolysaccharide biosynthesis protein n=1 Tax=Kribbella sp. CA-294648 TaxID=3239948 RepID=UPI003D8C581F
MSSQRLGSRNSAGGDAEAEVLARGGALNLVGAVVAGVAGLALVVVATRALGLAEAGRFFTVISIFLVLQTVGRLGADLGLVYFLARFRALGNEERVSACLRAAFGPVLLVACLLGGGLALAADPLARWALDGDGGGAVTMIRLLAVLLPLAVGYDLLLSISRGYSRMRPTVLLEKIGRPVLQLTAMIAVALAGGGPVALAVAWGLPFLPFAVLALGSARRALPAKHLSGGRTSFTASFWRFTAPRAVASCAQILLQRLDIIIVAALRGPADAAIYAAATRFLVAGQLGNQAISTAVQPRLSGLLALRDMVQAGRLYQISTAWLVAISWPIFGIAAAFAPWILDLFGDGYDEGSSVVVILSVAMMVATACGVVSIVLIMAGKTVWNLWNTLLALVLNIGIDLALVPTLGIVGAAIGWAVALLAANLVPLAQVWRSERLHPFGAGTLTSMVLSGLCFWAVPFTVGATLGVGGWQLLLAGGIGTAAYGVAVWRFRDVMQLDALRAIGRPGRRTESAIAGGSV